MVELLKQKYMECNTTQIVMSLDEHELMDLVVNELLDVVENLGMLPPPEYHEQDREAKVACNTAKKYMEWEPEDD